MISILKSKFLILGFVFIAVLLIPVNDAFADHDNDLLSTDLTVGHPSGTVIEWNLDYNELCDEHNLCGPVEHGFHAMEIIVNNNNYNGFTEKRGEYAEDGSCVGSCPPEIQFIKVGYVHYTVKLDTTGYPDGNMNIEFRYEYLSSSTYQGGGDFTIASSYVDLISPVITIPELTTDQWGNTILALSMSGTTNFPTGSWTLDVTDNVGVADSACWTSGGGNDPGDPWDSSSQSYDFSKITNPPSGQKFAIGNTHINCAAYDAAGNNGWASFNVVVTHDDPTGFVQYIDKPSSFGNTADSTTKIFYSAGSAQSLHLLKPIADLLTASNTQGMLARQAEWTLLDGAITIKDDPFNEGTTSSFYARMSGDGYDREIAKPLATMLTDANMSGMLERNNPDRSWTSGSHTITISESSGNFAAMVKICSPSGGGTSCQENHVLKLFADMLNESNLNQAMFERSNMKILDAGGPAASAPESSSADTDSIQTPNTSNLTISANSYLNSTSPTGRTLQIESTNATSIDWATSWTSPGIRHMELSINGDGVNFVEDNFRNWSQVNHESELAVKQIPIPENWSAGTYTVTYSTWDCNNLNVCTGVNPNNEYTTTVVIPALSSTEDTDNSQTSNITISANPYLNSTSPTGRTLQIESTNTSSIDWSNGKFSPSGIWHMELSITGDGVNFVQDNFRHWPQENYRFELAVHTMPIPENWSAGTYTVTYSTWDCNLATASGLWHYSDSNICGGNTSPINEYSTTVVIPALSSPDTTPPVITVPDFGTDPTFSVTTSNPVIHTNSTGSYPGAIGWDGTGVSFGDATNIPSPACTGNFNPQGYLNGPVWFPPGYTMVTCSASDAAGNVGSNIFSVNVEITDDVDVVESEPTPEEAVVDTTPPVITVPTSWTNSTSNPEGMMQYYSVSASDDVGLFGIDQCSNSIQNWQELVLRDQVILEWDEGNPWGWTYLDWTSGNPEGWTDVGYGPEEVVGQQTTAWYRIDTPIGTTTVTCDVTNSAGHTGSASFTITVTDDTASIHTPDDTTPPVVSLGNLTGTSDWSGASIFDLRDVMKTEITATDASGISTIPSPYSIMSTFPNGNSSDQIKDDGNPGMVWCDNSQYWNNNGAIIALPVGETTIKCVAWDTSGNEGTASFTITVTDDTASIHTPDDTTPPFLTQNQNITLDATTTSNGAIVNYELPQVTDDDSGVELGPDCSPASGSFFTIGTTEVTCYAADWAENIGTTSFTVTVESPIAAPVEILTDVTLGIGQSQYNTDDAIFVTGIATPFTENNISIQVEDSSDNVVLVEQITPESSGIYTGIIFPNFLWSTSGNYTMSATYGNSTANTSFGFEFLEPIIDEYVSPTGITLQTDTSMYTIGDTIIIESALTDVGSGYEIGIFVEDPAGKLRAMQFLNTADSGSVLLLLKTQDNWIPGKYLVGAYDVLDNSATIRDEVYFDLVKPIPEITISPTVTTTESGDTITSYDAGDMAYFSTSLLSESTSDVLVTINVVDADDTTLGVAFFKSIVGKGDSELVLGFKIPEDAADGVAKIYVNTYTDWIDQGGIVIGSELLSEVNIDGVIVEVVEETVVEEVVEETVLPENTIPRLSTVTDITQSASFTTGSVVSYSLPLATSGVTTLDATCTPAPGSMFPIGSTQVTCTATNDFGNTGMTSFMVTINPILQTADQSLSVKVGKDSYNNLEPLFVTGSVGTVTGEPINLEVRDTQNNLISIEQVTPKESGVYSTVLTSNELWDNTGEYTIIAKYESVIALDTFEFELMQVEEVIPEKIPTSLFIDTLDSAYVLGDEVFIGVNLVDAGAGEPILLEVRDSQNDQVLIQSLNTDSDGWVFFAHQLDSSGEPGVYSVTATSDEWSFTNSENFIAVAQIPDITIGDVVSTLQDGTEVDSFESGDMGYFQTPIISESVSDVLITVNIFDVENTPLGLAYFNSKVVDDTFDITLGLQIPQDAAPGLATVYINTYTDWVSEGGVPILEEQISFVEIVPFSTASLTVSSEESESTAEVELVPITGNISVNTESTSYTTGNTIVISGSIQNLTEVEQPVVIIIVSPDGNFITIDQVSHDSSGNYSTIVTAGGTMNSSGEYEIRAQYGVNQITSTFDFTKN